MNNEHRDDLDITDNHRESAARTRENMKTIQDILVRKGEGWSAPKKEGPHCCYLSGMQHIILAQRMDAEGCLQYALCTFDDLEGDAFLRKYFLESAFRTSSNYFPHSAAERKAHRLLVEERRIREMYERPPHPCDTTIKIAICGCIIGIAAALGIYPYVRGAFPAAHASTKSVKPPESEAKHPPPLMPSIRAFHEPHLP